MRNHWHKRGAARSLLDPRRWVTALFGALRGRWLESEYRAIAADEAGEREALDWADSMIGDVPDDRW